MTLSAGEFLRRYVQHVLPRGFVKIRHFGLLANCYREERLELCRRLLLAVAVLAVACPQPSAAGEESGPVACPECGSRRWTRSGELARVQRECTKAQHSGEGAAKVTGNTS